MTLTPPLGTATPPRRRAPWWLWAVGVTLLTAATVALLGGFRDAPPSPLPRVELGETYKGTDLHVTVESVELSGLFPVLANTADDGEQFLIVTAVIENVTTSISYMANDSVRIRLDGVISADDEPDRFIELRNAGGVAALQPGLPIRVAFVWKVSSEGVSAGDSVVVGLIERFRVSGDPVFGDTSYGPRTLVGRINTTVSAGEVAPSDD